MLFNFKIYFSVDQILSSFCRGIAANGLQLPEGGDFEAQHCQPSRNYDGSKELDLTTESPLLGRCCYMQFFSLSKLIMLRKFRLQLENKFLLQLVISLHFQVLI